MFIRHPLYYETEALKIALEGLRKPVNKIDTGHLIINEGVREDAKDAHIVI